MKKSILSLFVFTLFQFGVKASIYLFLDMNNSPGEVMAAQAAAEKNGKKFLLFRDEEISEGRTKEKLKEFLINHTNSRDSIESVIISGHHKTDALYGEKGFLKRKEVIEALKESGQAEGVHSVTLWGCYTGRPDIANEYKEGLPRLVMVGGTHNGGYGRREGKKREMAKDLLAKGGRWRDLGRKKNNNEKVLYKLLNDIRLGA